MTKHVHPLVLQLPFWYLRTHSTFRRPGVSKDADGERVEELKRGGGAVNDVLECCGVDGVLFADGAGVGVPCGNRIMATRLPMQIAIELLLTDTTDVSFEKDSNGKD